MRGNLADQMFITIVFLAFCIVTIVSYMVWSEMSPALNQTLAMTPVGSSSSQTVMANTTGTLLMFDQLFIFMIIGTFIAIIISSFWLDTHPIFFIISFIGFIFQFAVYAILGNVYLEFEYNPAMQAAASNYPLMEMFWSNVPLIALIFSVVIIIALYLKSGGGGNAYSA